MTAYLVTVLAGFNRYIDSVWIDPVSATKRVDDLSHEFERVGRTPEAKAWATEVEIQDAKLVRRAPKAP